jgi:hypothetical protein
MTVCREQSPKGSERILLRARVLEHPYSLLNIQFTKSSKAVAFADDLIITIRNETIRAAENISNIEMRKSQLGRGITRLPSMKTSLKL